MNENISVRFLDGFPETIRGVTRWYKASDRYQIFISSDLTEAQKAKTFRHELHHILNGDFQSKEPVSVIEQRAHTISA